MNLKLKASARAKKTYILIESGSRAEIEKAVLDYIGVLGWARASPIFVEGGKKEGRTILAVNSGEVKNVRAAFELCPGKLKILRASGTIKGIER